MTMPHKTAVVDLLDEVLPDAGLVGACNVIRREADGPLLGTMLDFMIGPCDGRAAR